MALGAAFGLPLSIAHGARQTTVYLSGDIDIDNAHLIAGAVEFNRRGNPLVVLDLRDVTFIDSCGLRALLACEAELAARGARLELQNPARVLRSLHAGGLSHLLAPELAAAV